MTAVSTVRTLASQHNCWFDGLLLTSTSLLFPSHGDDHCDDPRRGATFGRNTEVTPIFFHRPCATSTYDSAENDIRDMLASPLYLQEREAFADQPRVYHSHRKLCVKLITFPSKRGETCSDVLTQKKVESRISLRQGLQIEQFKEKMYRISS